MASLVGLAHVGIYTCNIEASIAFYQALGFTLDQMVEGGTKLAILHVGSCVVELIQPQDTTQLEGLGKGAIAHLAIECKDIEALVAEYRAKGLIKGEAIVKTMEAFQGKNVFFEGPTGERIELFEYLMRA